MPVSVQRVEEEPFNDFISTTPTVFRTSSTSAPTARIVIIIIATRVAVVIVVGVVEMMLVEVG